MLPGSLWLFLAAAAVANPMAQSLGGVGLRIRRLCGDFYGKALDLPTVPILGLAALAITQAVICS